MYARTKVIILKTKRIKNDIKSIQKLEKIMSINAFAK